jgi:Zn-dependent metalloprotease
MEETMTSCPARHVHATRRYHAHDHHAICTIIPPHILKEVAKKGTEQQRDRALNALSVSAQFRGMRAVMPAMPLAVAPGVKRRTAYDAQQQQNLPGKLVRSEGDPVSSDKAVNEAYNGAGTVYDFYSKLFGRNSIDGNGLRLDSTVHYGKDFDNAFWEGRQMVYGDGDGKLFQRFTVSLDVIGHELTHGVTQYEAALVYQNQPGALNEHFSDVFGSLVKQWKLRQTAAKADWLIGAELLAPGIHGIALRSMKAPGTAYDDPLLGKDPQPDHMRNYYSGAADNGGVHINSGIPNKAFVLAAMEIGGNAWDKAGKVWYRALTERLRPNSNFSDARRATISAAVDLFGARSAIVKAVTNAWAAVGVK